MKYLLILSVAAVAGCATLFEAQDMGAGKVADAIDRYCAETTESVRLQFRESINKKTPHSIEVTCN